MQVSIPCATFVRIATAAFLSDDKPAANISYDVEPGRAVRLEVKAGNLIAIATNFRILAAELIGTSDEPDGSVAVTIDPLLISACISATAAEDAMLNVVLSAGWAVASLSTGYFYPGNALVAGDLPRDWRTLFQTLPEKRNGAMAFDADMISRLGSASPSGLIVFPKIIDGSGSVIVNDVIDPDWIGIFMSARDDDDAPCKPAIIKGWCQ